MRKRFWSEAVVEAKFIDIKPTNKAALEK